MDDDRKYKQNGYQDSHRESNGNGHKAERPKQSGPRPSMDITGPRLPRLLHNNRRTSHRRRKLRQRRRHLRQRNRSLHPVLRRCLADRP